MEAAPGAVSFFFMDRELQTILCAWTFAIISLFWLGTIADAQAQSPTGDRLAAASTTEWKQYVARTLAALHGDGATNAPWVEAASQVPQDQRWSWLKERLNEWMNTEAFVRVQASHWIEDRCHPSTAFAFDTHWNIELHDAWIHDAIRRNISFLRFQQLQIAGDLMPPSPRETAAGFEERIATATLWRAHPQQPFFSLKPHEVRTILQDSGNPSLVSVPTNLRWDRLKGIPWLLTQETQSQGQRMLDGERAFDSVRKSEVMDWNRIVQGQDTMYWHQKEGKYPVPDSGNLVMELATLPDDVLTTHSDQGNECIDFPATLRPEDPWTMVIEMEIPAIDSSSNDVPPVALLEWIGDPKSSMEGKSRFAVVWEKQRWILMWDHAPPYSAMTMEIPHEGDRTGTCTLAIVYDGIPAPDAVRVWIDGSYRPMKVREDRLLGTYVSGSPQVLRVTRAAPAATNLAGVPIVEDLSVYRTALTEAELVGRWSEPEWKDWDECTARERAMWYDHYARRYDSQWKYQRESLQFYAANLASLYQQIEKVPVAPSLGRMIVDRKLLPKDAWREDGLLSDERLRLAEDLGVRFASSLAAMEVQRQWLRLQGGVNRKAGRELPETEWKQLASEWIRHEWDRRWLLESLLLSDAWFRIAIASED